MQHLREIILSVNQFSAIPDCLSPPRSRFLAENPALAPCRLRGGRSEQPGPARLGERPAAGSGGGFGRRARAGAPWEGVECLKVK